MDIFEADLAALRDWWLVGGRERRRQSTCDEYTRHLRRWWEWSTDQHPLPSTTPTVRNTNAYIRTLRQTGRERSTRWPRSAS